MRNIAPRAILLPLFLALGACSYQFQGTRNPLKDLGVQKIYVKSFKNESFRPGIEQLFTTAMVREIQKSRAFILVDTERSADAVLTGTVTSADSTISSTKSVPLGTKSVQVASEYSANVNCSVVLTETGEAKNVIFSHSVSGSKVYPGATQTGDAGATVPLVNDSEQRIAYQFLATQLMSSVYQRMIDLF